MSLSRVWVDRRDVPVVNVKERDSPIWFGPIDVNDSSLLCNQQVVCKTAWKRTDSQGLANELCLEQKTYNTPAFSYASRSSERRCLPISDHFTSFFRSTIRRCSSTPASMRNFSGMSCGCAPTDVAGLDGGRMGLSGVSAAIIPGERGPESWLLLMDHFFGQRCP